MTSSASERFTGRRTSHVDFTRRHPIELLREGRGTKRQSDEGTSSGVDFECPLGSIVGFLNANGTWALDAPGDPVGERQSHDVI
jgi:hypothetical protein